jgi:hypothetical protein
VRSLLVLLVVVALVLIVVTLVRGGGSGATPGASPSASTSAAPSDSAGSDDEASAGGSQDTGADGAAADAGTQAPTPEAESPESGEAEELVRSGTEGAGTWTVAAPVEESAPTEGVLRTYALRVEDGIGIDADEAAGEAARILADERGWQGASDIVFHQVASEEEAEFTISIASPPTVDELCAPADTGGLWSCRIGPEVALNSDRWLHATPTYEDLAEYRAYMVNHEVGHFLGHGHVDCPGEGAPAPVMLQQSIDLQGCVPNAWPGTE